MPSKVNVSTRPVHMSRNSSLTIVPLDIVAACVISRECEPAARSIISHTRPVERECGVDIGVEALDIDDVFEG